MEKKIKSPAEVMEDIKALANEQKVEFSHKRLEYMQNGLENGAISANALMNHTKKSIEQYKAQHPKWKDKEPNECTFHDPRVVSTLKTNKEVRAFIIERENSKSGNKFYVGVLKDEKSGSFKQASFTKNNIDDVKSSIAKIEIGKMCDQVSKEFKEVANKIKEENSLKTEAAPSRPEPEKVTVEPQKDAAGPEMA